MEFHISREVRDRLKVDDVLFSYTGNVVFANVAASRKLAQQINDARGTTDEAERVTNAGALFAMGLIDELKHALVARYRKEVDPEVLKDAVKWFEAQLGPKAVEHLLREFTERFPNTAVYRGRVTTKEWLDAATEGMPNREAALEELMMLWLANRNPAFKGFRELFEDDGLKGQHTYQCVTEALPKYFETRPPVAPGMGTLIEELEAPFLASPDSLAGQLDYIREHWVPQLGVELKRVLLAIDTLREEDLAIWARFHPPGPDRYEHGAPGFGGEGFVGDEYVGFAAGGGADDEYVTMPDGTRQLRYASGYQAPLNEYEAFSVDQAWMPNVVLIAKSTYVWLEQLSKKYGRHIHRLDQIPDEELQLLVDRGINALWLIGLWERSTASMTIKRLRGQHDAVASAYSLKDYAIAEDLGGDEAYRNLRDRAARHGMRLASDMVPNHMGIDSSWVIEHPEWFLYRWESPFPVYRFEGPDLSTDPRVEIKIEDHYYEQTDAAVVFRLKHYRDNATRYVYHGNDGTTFAWNDTAQLDYSQAAVREHVMQVILHVARLFPIIRFDAAMVLAKRHVQRLWFPLPGAGGSIPSRAEDAMSQEAFDALMPHEFWREVVDRVAVEVPGTLLLAEAFWLLEGYFVRTLGMHRVYNSAFMNMLRDEENAKYRSYLKKTIEFDPDILKRYVSFMSNPDEKTAIDQFGSGDKYFGVCTLLATLPGLPMFGHGQIEGFTERYGMEFKQAKMVEWPNDDLVARHMHEIAPLLKRRPLFAESDHFVMYDFWAEGGGVDENVFAYSNRRGGERALILYNNSYGSTHGTIHVSAAYMDKGSGELRQRSLSDGLGLPDDGEVFFAYRDTANGLEYLRRASDVVQHGMKVDLRGYQYMVMLDWRELRVSEEQPWHKLHDMLGGGGVHSVEDALTRMRLRPLHEALRRALKPEILCGFETAKDGAAEENVAHFVTDSVAFFDRTVEHLGVEAFALPEGSAEAVDEVAAEEIDEAEVKEMLAALDIGAIEATLAEEMELPEEVLGEHQASAASVASVDELRRVYRERCEALAVGMAGLGAISAKNDAGAAKKNVVAGVVGSVAADAAGAWPKNALKQLPHRVAHGGGERLWAPVLAWAAIESLPLKEGHGAVFDALMLRPALAESFSSAGMEGEDTWRAAARVRILLEHDGVTEPLYRESFWQDGDVRWLLGVNESDGVSYFNRELLEEMAGWLEVPRVAEGESADAAGRDVAEASERAVKAEYRVKEFLAGPAVTAVATLVGEDDASATKDGVGGRESVAGEKLGADLKEEDEVKSGR